LKNCQEFPSTLPFLGIAMKPKINQRISTERIKKEMTEGPTGIRVKMIPAEHSSNNGKNQVTKTTS